MRFMSFVIATLLVAFSLSLVRAEDDPASVPKADEGAAKFVAFVLGNVDREWTDIFRQDGKTFSKPGLVLYNGMIRSACNGVALSGMGPLYCQEDRKIYLDVSFLGEIENRFHGCGGDPCQLAQAYVIAHEVGHHVQNLLGILPKIRQALLNMDGTTADRIQLRTELQADCFVGMWVKHENDRLDKDGKPALFAVADAAAALQMVSAVGGDTVHATGREGGDRFTHGTPEQRQRWFSTGYQAATVAACNTFRSND